MRGIAQRDGPRSCLQFRTIYDIKSNTEELTAAVMRSSCVLWTCLSSRRLENCQTRDEQRCSCVHVKSWL